MVKTLFRPTGFGSTIQPKLLSCPKIFRLTWGFKIKISFTEFFFNFQDPRISTALPLIDLIDSIKPGVINYELLQEGGNYEVKITKPLYSNTFLGRKKRILNLSTCAKI